MKANLYRIVNAKDASQILALHAEKVSEEDISSRVGVTVEAVTEFLKRTEEKAKPKRRTATKTDED